MVCTAIQSGQSGAVSALVSLRGGFSGRQARISMSKTGGGAGFSAVRLYASERFSNEGGFSHD